MFKVGDIIVPLISANNEYNWTNQRYHWKGIVVGVFDGGFKDIQVRTLECDRTEGFRDEWYVQSRFFELEASLEKFIKSLAERKTVERERND